MKSHLLLIALPVLVAASPRFTAEEKMDNGVAIIRLTDTARNVEVSIAPSLGNRAYELKVRGQNLLFFPFHDAAAFEKDGTPALNGIPFLAPWGNRMAGGGFWADGKRYTFNPDLGSLRLGAGEIAIHGLLTASRLWKVIDLKADGNSAHLTSKLEFWKYPELMANWPFAHEYRMTHTLNAEGLEVSTEIANLSNQPMPVSIGFHPYFNLPGIPRAEATIHIPARQHVETDSRMVATGDLKPNALPDLITLKDHVFDDGFTDLVRDAEGRAVFSLQARGKKIEVLYGRKYQVAVVFAPPGREFVCFEPMTAITNGVNLAHVGKYSELETVAPGATWGESFWVRPTGF